MTSRGRMLAAAALALGLTVFGSACSEPEIKEALEDPRGRFRGTVVDTAGRPVEGAVIEISAVESAGPVPGRALKTDGGGRFQSMPLTEGTYSIQPVFGKLVFRPQQVTITAEDTEQLRFEPAS